VNDDVIGPLREKNRNLEGGGINARRPAWKNP
jgi:hypothetical protein